ncbi:peptidoglycan-binding domain-containing protein [Actinokineospora sp. HUAS TT18]|uniref:peptidoglycan-binding domain-containing protein n=1 Tax=Actinokineospora sp. HUAS TT18 TaxID=3447451 RepID=UPI003F520B0F
MAEEPRLERGQEGEWVQYLQQTLEHRGYACGATDGQFGEVLEEAVKQFQSAAGVTADGVVDDQTWDALVRGGETADTSTTDERMTNFDIAQYPLLADAAQYGEGDEAVRQFLIGRGLDSRFVDEMLAGSY